MIRRLAAASIAALVVSAGVVVAAQAKVDVTGKWALEVTTDAGGTTTPTVELKQQGEKLSGHYSSATLGEAEVTGTVKGQQITFSFTAGGAGQSAEVTYSGTVEGKDSMKGTISIPGLAEGTFTGKRQ